MCQHCLPLDSPEKEEKDTVSGSYEYKSSLLLLGNNSLYAELKGQEV